MEREPLSVYNKLAIFQIVSGIYTHLPHLKDAGLVDIYLGNDYKQGDIICTFEHYNVGKFTFNLLDDAQKISGWGRYRVDAYGNPKKYVIVTPKSMYPELIKSVSTSEASLTSKRLNENKAQIVFKNNEMQNPLILTVVYGRVNVPILDVKSEEGMVYVNIPGGRRGKMTTDNFMYLWREPFHHMHTIGVEFVMLANDSSLYKIPYNEFQRIAQSHSENENESQWTKKYKVSQTELKPYEVTPF